MIARGFKSVGWVAAVATAAIGCYMLSLNVAAERAEVESIERRIIATKQDIRALQTELGTRGRMAELDRWNAEVLALSAPTSSQLLADEYMLARFDRVEPTIEDRAKVQLAAAETTGAATPVVRQAARVVQASYTPADDAPSFEPQRRPLVRQASYVPGALKPFRAVTTAPVIKASTPKPVAAKTAPVAKAPAKKPGLLDARLVDDLAAAARSEARAGSDTGR